MSIFTNTEACNFGVDSGPGSVFSFFGWGEFDATISGQLYQTVLGEKLPFTVGDYRVRGHGYELNAAGFGNQVINIQGDLTGESEFFPNDLQISDSVVNHNSSTVVSTGWTRSYNATYDYTSYRSTAVVGASPYTQGTTYNTVFTFTDTPSTQKTFAELKTSIQSWLKRRNITDDQISEFIEIGELMLRDGVEYVTPKGKILDVCLRVREMEKTKVFSVNSGDTDSDSSTDAITRLNLPSDYLEAKRLSYGSSQLERSTAQSGSYWRTKTDTPQGFYREGDFIYITPSPDSVDDVTLVYYADFAGSLINDTDSNDILTNYYSCYLYAALLAAEPYLFNDKRVPLWERKLVQAVRSANNRERKETRSGGFKRMGATF